MGFTKQIFLFIFFPGCMLLDALASWAGGRFGWFQKLRLREWLLIGLSLVFYGWACFDDIGRLAVYVFLIYLAGRWLHSLKEKGRYFLTYGKDGAQRPVFFAQLGLGLTIALTVVCLVHFKYAAFLTELSNGLLGTASPVEQIAAPLGISFITFSAISYLADIYQGKATPGKLTDCALYLTFFPKVISGPIVLWRDFQGQLHTPAKTPELTTAGLNRIMTGFVKKVLLADVFGGCLASMAGQNVDVVTAWGAAVLYMLQLYYDFAGYSDIAIGLSNLLGFRCAANFNFPYRSQSIGEFWRRWHISLGTWFRTYIYIPLGGSRVSLKRNLLNLGVVFALTGIWHGAGWNYVLWGGINGCMVVLERLLRDTPGYRRTPGWVKWLGTMGITFFCWELLRFSRLSDALRWVGIMFGAVSFQRIPYGWQFYFDGQILFLAAMGILGSTVFGSKRVLELHRRITSKPLGYLAQQVVLLGLFAAAILFVVNSTYSPFLYFQY